MIYKPVPIQIVNGQGGTHHWVRMGARTILTKAVWKLLVCIDVTCCCCWWTDKIDQINQLQLKRSILSPSIWAQKCLFLQVENIYETKRKNSIFFALHLDSDCSVLAKEKIFLVSTALFNPFARRRIINAHFGFSKWERGGVELTLKLIKLAISELNLISETILKSAQQKGFFTADPRCNNARQ